MLVWNGSKWEGVTGSKFEQPPTKKEDSVTYIQPDIKKELQTLRFLMNQQKDQFWKEAEFLNDRVGKVEATASMPGPSYDVPLEAMQSRIDDLEDEIEEVKEVVMELAATKIDKPSVSPELVAAETYIDDYMKIRKRFARERFAAKKRVERKVARLKKAAEYKEKKARNKTRGKVLGSLAALGSVVALAIILL
jgi:hypothetical protein